MFYLDASAWVKRYQKEVGTEWMAQLLALQPAVGCSDLGLVEVVSAITRRHRGQSVSSELTEQVLSAVKTDFERFLRIEFTIYIRNAAEGLAARHGLRAADAVHLASALRARQSGQAVVLVSSDHELLLAANAEGLAALDPQESPPLPLL